MARILTTVLRIWSISAPQNIKLLLAANIFVAAGVVMIYIINLLFALRLLRSSHPHLGWNRIFSIIFYTLIGIVVATIVVLITAIIQSYETLNPQIRRIDRDITLYGVTYFGIVAFLPIPLVIVGLSLPKHSSLDKIGTGRWRTKVSVLLVATALISSGALFRMATSWKTPVPHTQPLPGYFHRAYFYIFNFGVEIIVLYLYAFLRIDRRFHIPNGAHGLGSYSSSPKSSLDGGAIVRVFSEEETFDGVSLVGSEENIKDVEAGLGATAIAGQDSWRTPASERPMSQAETLRSDDVTIPGMAYHPEGKEDILSRPSSPRLS
jgi:hypothetical protein